MSVSVSLISVIRRAEQLRVVRAVRGGLVDLIPVLIIGAFSLIFQTFPVEIYQKAVTTFADGIFLTLFELIYNATFGVLSLYMTFLISRSYMRLNADPETVRSGAAIASLISFFILAGAYLPDFGIDRMGPKSMFLAIITGLGASALYTVFHRSFRGQRYLFTAGADRTFNRMLTTIIPIGMVALCFAVFSILVMRIFDVDCFHTLLINAFNGLFSHGEAGFLKGFFFVLFSSLLWFFGIHGSDTLEGVMQTYFTPGLEANQAAIAAGGSPEVILTKGFFDCFVLMGGCGATICLLIVILLFSRNRARRGLGFTAAFPMIFNINEIMVFGLPIIFNPTMLIPFLTVPLVCYSTAYIAVSSGLVPMVTSDVAWTTPILLGGYMATGSLAGSLLQLVNVTLGVLIYLPFVRILDRQSAVEMEERFASFMNYFRENEQELVSERLIDHGDVFGAFAKGLCADLRQGLDKSIVLAYQPQYHYNGTCVGVEALLRWNHPDYGLLYPPLVIKLAEEGGFLMELEEAILQRALEEQPEVLRRFGPEVHLSVNVTGTTVVSPRFLQYVRQLDRKDPFRGKNLCIEVTEQAAITFNEETLKALHSLRDLGLMLAIDDFSMGQTSVNYLKDNLFDIIKLDGSLVKGLFTFQNCREIISSISRLAASLGMLVLAEYVENEEQREALHGIGCDCYQGYLYSPAVFLTEPKVNR